MSWDCPRTGNVPGQGQDEDKRGQIYFGYQIIISFLKKKRERWKKEDCYLDYIGEKSILINQKVIVSQVDF